MATSMRLVDGSFEVVLRATNPSPSDAFLRSEYIVEGPAVREVVQNRVGISGTVDQTNFGGSGKIIVNGVVQSTATGTWQKWFKQLQHFTYPDLRFYIYIQEDGVVEETRYYCRAIPTSLTKGQANVTFCEFSFEAITIDGFAESTTLYESEIRAPSASSGGILVTPDTGIGQDNYDDSGIEVTEFGILVTGSNVATSTTITISGGTSAWPIFYIYGQCTDPVIRNLDTGQVYAFYGLSIPAGSYVEINTKLRTVYLNSDVNQNYYQFMSFAESAWWPLLRGTNYISFGTSSQSATCKLLIRYRELFI